MRYFYMMLNHSGNHIKIEHEFFKPDRNPTERLHLQTHDPLLVPQDPTEGIGPVFIMPFHFNKSLWGNRGRTILSLKYSLYAPLPHCSISTPVIFLREKEQFFFLLSKVRGTCFSSIFIMPNKTHSVYLGRACFTDCSDFCNHSPST